MIYCETRADCLKPVPTELQISELSHLPSLKLLVLGDTALTFPSLHSLATSLLDSLFLLVDLRLCLLVLMLLFLAWLSLKDTYSFSENALTILRLSSDFLGAILEVLLGSSDGPRKLLISLLL